MEKITLYYFLIGGKVTLARGENVKLFLVDAGLDHEYVRVEREDWPAMKEQLSKEGYYAGSMPYIRMGNQIFGRSVSIMRYLSVKMGHKYHGSTEEENYLLDVIADMTDDWFECMKAAFFGGDEKRKQHEESVRPAWLNKFEKYYSDNTQGPYILGEKITYPDFLVYHLIDDDSARNMLGNYPNLKRLVNEFEARPNIKQYLETL
ncbi:glutathione S-transferase [Sporodiniella umbellata]|nr:glutathione S-transferase [Sporodiniella umbellata]